MIQRDKRTQKLLFLPNRSVQETELYFRDAQNRWGSSSQCKELTKLLDTNPHFSVQKIVAFANVSMALGNNSNNYNRHDVNSSYQHSLMLALKHHFGASKCSAQDPVYTDAEIAVLRSYGIRVIR
jgi:hypothetical protein